MIISNFLLLRLDGMNQRVQHLSNLRTNSQRCCNIVRFQIVEHLADLELGFHFVFRAPCNIQKAQVVLFGISPIAFRNIGRYRYNGTTELAG